MACTTLVNRMWQPCRIRKTAQYAAKRKEIEPAASAQVCHNASLQGWFSDTHRVWQRLPL
jgi:hypothetical protein